MAQENKTENLIFRQLIPLALTLAVFGGLWALTFFIIRALNFSGLNANLVPQLKWGDVLVGALVYFKTAIDFVVFMGLLMKTNGGWKKRVAIEIGTALGNFLGTILILVLWVVFKQLALLLGIMILLSALVLFELAGEGLEHFKEWGNEAGLKKILFWTLNKILSFILKIIRPLTSKIVPDFSAKLKGERVLGFGSLLIFSLSIPFILGLDNFAGYVPLFSLVNVFGFAVGTLAAHMLLNLALFLNPGATVKVVENKVFAFLGSAAFAALAFWGIIEAVKIFAHA